jgi:CelD/BcsL family acetyltransferase involved in cellulose biosynthesis
MELRVLTTDHEFDALQGEWNELVESSPASMPFTRYEYLRTWWRTQGGGEWPRAALRLVVAREGDRLVGVAPFFRAAHEERRAWLLLGSIEISDYLDLIVARGKEEQFVRHLLDLAAAQPADEFERLDLYNLRAGSKTLDFLESLTGPAGWQTEKQELQPCPSIALPGSWEAYLDRLDKKQRHEVRRKLRRSQGDEEEIAWAIVEPQADVQAAIEKFLALMKLDERKAAFLSAPMVEQFRLSLAAAHAAGWLQLALLTVDGRPAAAYANFDYANRIWVYNSAIDPHFAALSPGWILLARLIEWAIEHRREAFDFMRGNEGYKFQWGGVNRPIYRLKLGRPVR